MALGGELRGARYRWDLSESPQAGASAGAAIGAPPTTTIVWRGNLNIGGSSSLVRAMFRIEPSFEHSANVAVGIASMRAMVRRAIDLAAAKSK